jgi:hypothetical protein
MRAILVGDNQFDLFASLDDVLRSIERPEAESGDYCAFDEDGNKYNFKIDPSNDAQVGSFELMLVSNERFAELLEVYRHWTDLNGLKGLPEPTPRLFDELEEKWGLRKF